MSMVRLERVTKSFGSLEVLQRLDLAIEEGEFVVFVGPSGSGKSTLLRIIAGLEDATQGNVSIDGKDVTFAEPAERGIAMVFQSYALYPHMNVRQNMAFNLQLAGVRKPDIGRRVEDAAAILRLTDLLERAPAQLSGGQRQRVAIGRAIVRNPKVFLFDEPLSNLDAALRVQMRLEIERLHRELGTTMVYVTHDQVEAMTLADRIVVLDGGVIQQIGRPLDLYRSPANQFVAEFVGSPRMNVIAVRSLGDAAARFHRATTIGVRPEALRFLPTGAAAAGGVILLPVRSRAIERLGNISYGYFETTSGDQLVAQFVGDVPFEPDAAGSITFDENDVHLFAADGLTLAAPQYPTTKPSTHCGGNHVSLS